jgi:hypothetical protein
MNYLLQSLLVFLPDLLYYYFVDNYEFAPDFSGKIVSITSFLRVTFSARRFSRIVSLFFDRFSAREYWVDVKQTNTLVDLRKNIPDTPTTQRAIEVRLETVPTSYFHWVDVNRTNEHFRSVVEENRPLPSTEQTNTLGQLLRRTDHYLVPVRTIDETVPKIPH